MLTYTMLNAADRAALPTGGPQPVGPDTYLTLTYRKNIQATDATVEVQTCTDLISWATVTPDIGPAQIGTDGSTGDPIIQVGAKCASIPKMFIRLKVTVP